MRSHDAGGDAGADAGSGSDAGSTAGSAAESLAGIDAVALKPAEHDLSRAPELPVETVALDYEGREHLPDAAAVRRLAADRGVVVTTPVRADGFDPLGDDALLREWLPAGEGIRRALVAGHPAYLTDAERERSVAERFGAALRGIDAPAPWVGTEGVERIALATGHTQYELLSRRTDRAVGALRAAGFEGDVAVYAPTVLADDEDAVLDAVGGYVARRGPVADALPAGASTDASAEGRAREVLSAAARDYALVGSETAVSERVAALKAAGVTTVVAYPARGLDAFLS